MAEIKSAAMQEIVLYAHNIIPRTQSNSQGDNADSDWRKHLYVSYIKYW